MVTGKERTDGDNFEADAKVFGEPAAVVDGALRRIGAGHADSEDVLGTESFDGDGGDESGVDAAAKADKNPREAALADVVAGAEDEGAKNGFVFVAGLGVHVAGERFGVDEDEIFFE